ncbi:MAG: peptidoglycan DD-metalloendopeptidase family protein [Oscillospiraceae bacterium]|nr:peptidoglycan DD-metalloendopeptidase family protein [Oscillospiraceae bacterium]
MAKQKKKRRLSALLAALTALSLLLAVLPAPAYADTQDEVDELERRKESVEEQAEEKQAAVDELRKRQANVLEQKQALDERNRFLYEQISINAEQIALYDLLIAQKALEVDKAKAKELEQLRRWRARVRAMEENGKSDYLSMLLGANTLGEFLTAIDDIGEIMESDKRLEDAYIAAREHTEKVKADYEQYKSGLEAKKKALNEETARIRAEIDETGKLLEKIKSDLESYSGELEELLRSEQDAEDLIERKIAEIQSGQDTAAAGGYGTFTAGSEFGWPCSCVKVIDKVGYRGHPISGEWSYHSGMDVACRFGETVWASNSGTVVIAGPTGGYGNCVLIDHGSIDGEHYYTLYGHLSSISVSIGQTVLKGEHIGAAGSSGVCTGPHLHFEIRDSDGPTDFAWRFPDLDYSAVPVG